MTFGKTKPFLLILIFFLAGLPRLILEPLQHTGRAGRTYPRASWTTMSP